MTRPPRGTGVTGALTTGLSASGETSPRNPKEPPLRESGSPLGKEPVLNSPLPRGSSPRTREPLGRGACVLLPPPPADWTQLLLSRPTAEWPGGMITSSPPGVRPRPLDGRGSGGREQEASMRQYFLQSPQTMLMCRHGQEPLHQDTQQYVHVCVCEHMNIYKNTGEKKGTSQLKTLNLSCFSEPLPLSFKHSTLLINN